jgi:hypothetical protein
MRHAKRIKAGQMYRTGIPNILSKKGLLLYVLTLFCFTVYSPKLSAQWVFQKSNYENPIVKKGSTISYVERSGKKELKSSLKYGKYGVLLNYYYAGFQNIRGTDSISKMDCRLINLKTGKNDSSFFVHARYCWSLGSGDQIISDTSYVHYLYAADKTRLISFACLKKSGDTLEYTRYIYDTAGNIKESISRISHLNYRFAYYEQIEIQKRVTQFSVLHISPGPAGSTSSDGLVRFDGNKRHYYEIAVNFSVNNLNLGGRPIYEVDLPFRPKKPTGWEGFGTGPYIYSNSSVYRKRNDRIITSVSIRYADNKPGNILETKTIRISH